MTKLHINTPGVFVTGTDTEVGKTVVSAGLLARFAKEGLQVAGYKPVAAGCDPDGKNDDAKALLMASNVPLEYAEVNPYALPAAKAPHLAAEEVGEKIELSTCVAGAQKLALKSDLVVAEGAGGWSVPLNSQDYMADIANALQWPVVLVVGLRLGCLSHALLTVAKIQQDGLPILGWVANHLSANWPDADKNIETLQQHLEAPLLGQVPFQKRLCPNQTAEHLLCKRVIIG